VGLALGPWQLHRSSRTSLAVDRPLRRSHTGPRSEDHRDRDDNCPHVAQIHRGVGWLSVLCNRMRRFVTMLSCWDRVGDSNPTAQTVTIAIRRSRETRRPPFDDKELSPKAICRIRPCLRAGGTPSTFPAAGAALSSKSTPPGEANERGNFYLAWRSSIPGYPRDANSDLEEADSHELTNPHGQCPARHTRPCLSPDRLDTASTHPRRFQVDRGAVRRTSPRSVAFVPMLPMVTLATTAKSAEEETPSPSRT